jgi:hypothetical protein
MNEEWRPVVGYPGYEVSSHGRVRSLPRVVTSDKRSAQRYPGKSLRTSIGKIGYPVVQLGRQSGPKYVHELVCGAFHGQRPEGFTVSHLDGCKTNNNAENLAWESFKENFAHKVRHGTMNWGERQGHAKLTEHQVRLIRCQPQTRGMFSRIARLYGVSPTSVESAYKRRTWRHI